MKKTSALSHLGQRTSAPPISWLMGLTLAHPKLISLAAGFTDNATLPVAATRRLASRLLHTPDRGRPALQYGSTPGYPQLRDLTSRRLRQLDQHEGPAYGSDNILITHGSQQLLYLLTEALCDPGDIVLVEDPTYFVYLGIAQSHGLRCRTLRMTRQGLDLDHLKTVLDELARTGDLRRLKLLYMISYFQNPSGVTTSLETKRGALALLRRYERAAGHPLYLLEDAAYRELRFTGADIPSALTLPGAAERVAYTSTYSKPFATGVRVGFGFLPEPLRTACVRLKGNHDFGTANFLQHLVAEALASGEYARHLLELQARYRRKSGVMHQAMTRHLPGSVQWTPPQGGLYFWPSFPKGLPTGPRSKLFQSALATDVLYVPGSLCYAPDTTRRIPGHEMRLSFGSASEADIREGLRRLGQVIATLSRP